MNTVQSFSVLTMLVVLLVPALVVQADPKLVLVTLDGVRWQEVFTGINQQMIKDTRYTKMHKLLQDEYWRKTATERRQLLFPFLWSTIIEQGILIGDRSQNSYMEVSNDWWFSYPGYNEILTGRPDPDIDSNAKTWNKNITFLEALNNTESFKDSVVAFGSWDVFPYIINTRRSGLPVNAGFDIDLNPTTDKSRWLNELAIESPKLWDSVRLDHLTHGYAMESLKNNHPRVIYIAYGETDDFAHDGRYDRYIEAANRTDKMLETLWHWLQSDPFYRDQTTLIITTDHGRGDDAESWQHHLSQKAAKKMGILDQAPDGVPGSDQVWFAAIGPQIKARGLVSGHWKQSQVTATALSSLQLNPRAVMPEAAPAIQEIFR